MSATPLQHYSVTKLILILTLTFRINSTIVVRACIKCGCRKQEKSVLGKSAGDKMCVKGLVYSGLMTWRSSSRRQSRIKNYSGINIDILTAVLNKCTKYDDVMNNCRPICLEQL